MDGLFQRLALTSRATVERVHGADVMIFPVIRPKTKPDAPLVLDPEKPAYGSVCCFFQNTEIKSDANAQPSMAGGSGRTMLRAPQVQGSIRLIAGQSLKTEYFVRRISDGALFTVAQCDPDGSGNALCLLQAAANLPGA